MGVAVESIVPSSAAPALSLLEEQEPILQSYALRSLNTLADSFWPEISSAVAKIQELSEDEAFSDRNLAAIVAAKVNFHLGSLDEALHYALCAGHLFDVDAETQFANTLRARCIDEYITLQRNRKEAQIPNETSVGTSTDHAFADSLQTVVERVLEGCIKKGEIHEAIGVAIEARRLDKVETAIIHGCKSDEAKMEALAYCFESAQNLISTRGYRVKVLNLIASIHISQFSHEKRDYIAISNCYVFTGNAKGVADILMGLVDETKIDEKDKQTNLELVALQIAFDVVDNDAPFFAPQVLDILPEPKLPEATPAAPASSQPANNSSNPDDPVPMETESPNAPDTSVEDNLDNLSKHDKTILKLRRVLRGDVTAELYLDFLCCKNKSDMYLLKKIKQSLDGRSSVCDSALLFSNAISHGGTAIDIFLRENLEWLAKHNAWAKFSATSCLGVIHARHTSAALNLLSPYLPSTAASRGSMATSFSEGGALYALGLIAASGGRDATLAIENNRPVIARQYLYDALRVPEINDVVKHGACLGLGLSAMASWDGKTSQSEYYEELKSVLRTDSAVASEAAGIGMGLIALGSGSEEVCKDLYSYAEDTEHEKIIRGASLGIALVCYGREDDSMAMIKKMLGNNEPIIRYGAMYAVALAYCGTADNNAIRMLLHSAVSDVSDDVRRAAVIALGFVLFRHPKLLPNIVDLLAESCHAHVRYGAAIAIGVSCMGTGMTAAANLLERLASDPSDFVKQGALIGLSLVFMHHTDERSPKSGEMRKTLEATWGAKLEDVITRFGAVVASGIANTGGRNGTISLTSANGHPRMTAIVGLAMFTQFWYWYPLVHFIGLAIKPSALICLNKDVKMPKMKVQSNAPEGLYAYLPSGPPEKAKEVASAPKAILSVTAKNLAREKRRAAARKREADEKDVESGEGKQEEKKKEESANGEEKEKDKKEEEVVKKVSAPYTILDNPCRVLPAQEQYICWDVTGDGEQRYEAVVRGRVSGIVMVRDLKPEMEEEIVPMQTLNVPQPPPTIAPAANTANGARRSSVNEEEEDDEYDVPVPEAFIYTDETDVEEKRDGEDKDVSMDGGEVGDKEEGKKAES